MSDKSLTEEIEVSGQKLMEELKNIVHEGNVRHVKIKNKEGKILLDMPLTVGAVGVLLLPFWAGVAAIVGLANEFTLTVEREEPAAEPASEPGGEPAPDTAG